MARTPRDELAMKDLAKRLTRLAKLHKAPGFGTMSKILFRDYGYDVHEESIRKAHRGEVDPTQCNVELLLALSAFYGAEPAALGSVAEHRITTARALVGAQYGGPDSPSDVSSGQSGWFSPSALAEAV